MRYMPAPTVIPTPTVAQTPAAVVMPLTPCFLAKMRPAPKNPTPVTMPAATREGSSLTFSLSTSKNPYFETTIIKAEASATIRCVRIPAPFALFFRSKPIAAPHAAATKILKKSSICSPKESNICPPFSLRGIPRGVPIFFLENRVKVRQAFIADLAADIHYPHIGVPEHLFSPFQPVIVDVMHQASIPFLFKQHAEVGRRQVHLLRDIVQPDVAGVFLGSTVLMSFLIHCTR